jgi:uncharacterized protein (TIGR02145 family)
MAFKCFIGLHTWDNCKCSACGKIRDEQHVHTTDCEICDKCGTVSENQHNWTKDCQKCSKCGKTREMEHTWKKDCEKCSKCNKTRKDQHHLVDGICSVCGNGTLHDEKGGINYRVVKIGNQVVMAENFASTPHEGAFWAYDKDEKNVVSTGYLYDLETAKAMAPKGWHLPTKEEWDIFYKHLGGKDKEVYEHVKVGGESGFEGLFGGWRFTRGVFNSLGASGHFWSCTEVGEKEVWHFKISAYSGHAEIEKVDKGYGLSIRYFRD